MADPLAPELTRRLLPTLGALVSALVIAGSLAALAVFGFSLLGRYFFYAELLGNFRLQILIFLSPFALAALATRRWWLTALLLATITWSLLVVGLLSFGSDSAAPGGPKLKLMSFNVLAQNQNVPGVLARIAEYDPDVVAILEYANHWHEALDALNETYPHQARHPRWHGFGIAIFSKLPLSNVERYDLIGDRTDSPMPLVDVQLGDRSLRIAAVHVLSPTNSYRLKLRNEQFIEMAQVLPQRDIPTVVLGDFNCTPWSPFLSDFLRSTGYRDSRQGFGYQASWHSYYWYLGVPIDHAFVSSDVKVWNRQIGETASSDHFPVLLTISLDRE